MNDMCHPVYYKIGQLGCNRPGRVITAFRVYMELCELKRLWDVNYFYNESSDLIYLTARTKKDSEPEIYIPWQTTQPITLEKMEQIERDLEAKHFTLVIKEGDSTSAFYRVTSGLQKTFDPKTSEAMKQAKEQKLRLEREIRKNTRNLYELATEFDREEETDEPESSSKRSKTDSCELEANVESTNETEASIVSNNNENK